MLYSETRMIGIVCGACLLLAIAAGILALPYLGIRMGVQSNPIPAKLSTLSDSEGQNDVDSLLSKAHDALAREKFLLAVSLFDQVVALSQRESNKIQTAKLCVRCADTLMDTSSRSASGNQASPALLQEEAQELYRKALKLYKSENWTAESKIETLDKLRSAGASAAEQQELLQLLVDSSYPPNRLVETSYDTGTALWREYKEKEAEAAYLIGARTAEKTKAYGFPGPATALADLYEEQEQYAKEVVWRRFAAKRSAKIFRDEDEYVYPYTHASYEKLKQCLKRLGRTDEYERVAKEHAELIKLAKEKGRFETSFGDPPHRVR